MKQLVKGASIVFVLAFCMSSVGLESRALDRTDAPTSDDYAVYLAAMEKVVGGGSYVVLDTTVMHDKPEKLDQALSFPVEDADRVTDDLIEDFKVKNQKPQAISPFPFGARVTFITEPERTAMFAGCVRCGWKTFHEKYLGAPGITSLSRVGFNQKRDTALVYIDNLRHWEAGQGMYLLLRKTDGEWKVISRTRGWAVGVVFGNGIGVQKGELEAVRWYCKAADQGLARAQFNLGRAYAIGAGVAKDEVEAARWYRKAADQGNEMAKRALD